MSDYRFMVPIKPSDTFYEKLKEAMARIHPAFENVNVKDSLSMDPCFGLEAQRPDPLEFWFASLRPYRCRIKNLMEFMVNCPYSVVIVKYLTDCFKKIFERPSLDHVIRPLAVEVAVTANASGEGLSVEHFLEFINSEIGVNLNVKDNVEDSLCTPPCKFLTPQVWCTVSIVSHACVNRSLSSDEIIEKIGEDYIEDLQREVKEEVEEGTEMAIESLKEKIIMGSDDDVVYSKYLDKYLEVFKNTVTIALQCLVELIENPEKVAERCLSVDPVVSIEGVTIGPEDYDPEWSRVQRIEREIPSAEQVASEILDAVMNTSARRTLEDGSEDSKRDKGGSNVETPSESELQSFVEDSVREILGSRRESRR